jgi:hypothetical protein
MDSAIDVMMRDRVPTYHNIIPFCIGVQRRISIVATMVGVLRRVVAIVRPGQQVLCKYANMVSVKPDDIDARAMIAVKPTIWQAAALLNWLHEYRKATINN